MLKSRVIPCLQMREGLLYKTRQFGDPRYIGDPINAVRIFNEKEVDELMICDIGREVILDEAQLKLIEKCSISARMPLTYAGGVKSVEDAETIVRLGIEKCGIRSLFFRDKQEIKNISLAIGSQSTIVCLDARKVNGNWMALNPNNNSYQSLEKCIDFAQSSGSGEIFLTHIDSDGMDFDYNYELHDYVAKYLSVPCVISGGINDISVINNIIERYWPIGIGVSSLFLFKGKLKAFLISYYDTLQRQQPTGQ